MSIFSCETKIVPVKDCPTAAWGKPVCSYSDRLWPKSREGDKGKMQDEGPHSWTLVWAVHIQSDGTSCLTSKESLLFVALSSQFLSQWSVRLLQLSFHIHFSLFILPLLPLFCFGFLLHSLNLNQFPQVTNPCCLIGSKPIFSPPHIFWATTSSSSSFPICCLFFLISTLIFLLRCVSFSSHHCLPLLLVSTYILVSNLSQIAIYIMPSLRLLLSSNRGSCVEKSDLSMLMGLNTIISEITEKVNKAPIIHHILPLI